MANIKKKTTSKKIASAAGRILGNPKTKPMAKSAAASALTQYKKKEVTGAKAASAAGKMLVNPESSKGVKSVAASTLAQRIKKRKQK